MLKIVDGRILEDGITPGLPITHRIAENQEEYQTLPAHAGDGMVAFAFELDEEDLEQIKKNGKVYVALMTGGDPMQPIRVEVNPEVFEEEVNFDKALMRQHFANNKKIAAGGSGSADYKKN
jgi:hypothetical protein